MAEATPTKPYLLRALYEWCVDNGYTPYLSVIVDSSTRVPMEYVRGGEIVLNIGPLATSRMTMGNESIECTARFVGVARELSIPISQVVGMSFEAGVSTGSAATPAGPRLKAIAPATNSPEEPTPPTTPGKPTLRRVK